MHKKKDCGITRSAIPVLQCDEAHGGHVSFSVDCHPGQHKGCMVGDGLPACLFAQSTICAQKAFCSELGGFLASEWTLADLLANMQSSRDPDNCWVCDKCTIAHTEDSAQDQGAAECTLKAESTF